jgi:oligopeptide/dipeptide ABC transporter ATP-binding protein
LPTQNRPPVLSVRDLVVEFDTPDGPVRAVDGVSFEVHENEVLAIVGESGSGKSITMLAVTGLLPPGARVASGEVLLRGRDVLRFTEKDWYDVRGREVAMVFQDPMTAMNPVIRVGDQIAEMVRLHDRGLDRDRVRAKVVDLLRRVNVPNPASRVRGYPHEWSGGMRQRAMIAMAMAHDPALLIADEPTTALDVTVQAQVMETLREVRERVGSSMVLVTHDLGLVAENADRVLVMYSGRVLETADCVDLFDAPAHPYTAGLLASLLSVDDALDEEDEEEEEDAWAIPGTPPDVAARPPGCVFAPRCGLSGGRDRCTRDVPLPLPVARGNPEVVHAAACHFAGETTDWARRTHGGAQGTHRGRPGGSDHVVEVTS